jgi:hypothetical protein
MRRPSEPEVYLQDFISIRSRGLHLDTDQVQCLASDQPTMHTDLKYHKTKSDRLNHFVSGIGVRLSDRLVHWAAAQRLVMRVVHRSPPIQGNRRHCRQVDWGVGLWLYCLPSMDASVGRTDWILEP